MISALFRVFANRSRIRSTLSSGLAADVALWIMHMTSNRAAALLIFFKSVSFLCYTGIYRLLYNFVSNQ